MACNFVAAVVKGLVEKNDPHAYFGSTMGGYTPEAISKGLAERYTDGNGDSRVRVTEAGRVLYHEMKLSLLPRIGRAYMWDWSIL